METKLTRIDENTEVLENDYTSVTVVRLKNGKGLDVGYNIFASTKTLDEREQKAGMESLIIGLISYFTGYGQGIGMDADVIVKTIQRIALRDPEKLSAE